MKCRTAPGRWGGPRGGGNGWEGGPRVFQQTYRDRFFFFSATVLQHRVGCGGAGGGGIFDHCFEMVFYEMTAEEGSG